jgi:hypothetical protein
LHPSANHLIERSRLCYQGRARLRSDNQPSFDDLFKATALIMLTDRHDR